MKEVFSDMPRSRVALETGTHSPWVSRLLSELGHEVIVSHARNVRLIRESRRKDDRLDARMLARLARIDPQFLAPVKHRSRPGTGLPDGDTSASQAGASANGAGECGMRTDEVVWRAAAPLRPAQHGHEES